MEDDADEGTEFEVPVRSRWIWVVTAVTAALVVLGAVVYVRLGGTVRSLPQDVAAATSAAASGPALEPRPTGEACRGVRAGICGDDDQGLAPMPGVPAKQWRDRLPQHLHPTYEPQTREGLVLGQVSYPVAVVQGEVFDMYGQPMTDGPAPAAGANGQVSLVYGTDGQSRTIECRVEISAPFMLAPTGMDLLRACVQATVTDEIAAATNAWVATRLRPLEGQPEPAKIGQMISSTQLGGPPPVTSHWACGWLALELTVGYQHGTVTLSAPTGQATAACAEAPRR